MSAASAEDAAALLSDFVATLDNAPSEIAYLLSEISAKEERLQDHRSRIQSRDASIQKHHKGSSLLNENPKEATQVAKCRADFVKALQLADEKTALAERGVTLLARHLNRLNVEMGRLQGILPPSVSALFGTTPTALASSVAQGMLPPVATPTLTPVTALQPSDSRSAYLSRSSERILMRNRAQATAFHQYESFSRHAIAFRFSEHRKRSQRFYFCLQPFCSHYCLAFS